MSSHYLIAPLAISICVIIGALVPPSRQTTAPRLLYGVLAIAATFGLLALACLAVGLLNWAELAGVLGAGVFILYLWLAEAEPASGDAEGGEDEDGGGGGPDNKGPRPPCDWDKFDRLRANWSTHYPASRRPRAPAGV